MKQLIVASILFVLSTYVSAGCEGPNGSDLPLGYVINVDEHHEDTISRHKEFLLKHGIKPDGGAYKHAQCTFTVDLKLQDYPRKSEREYVWIALPRASRFSEKDMPPSYSDE